jgi:uncharacterized OsmC-like protein
LDGFGEEIHAMSDRFEEIDHDEEVNNERKASQDARKLDGGLLESAERVFGQFAVSPDELYDGDREVDEVRRENDREERWCPDAQRVHIDKEETVPFMTVDTSIRERQAPLKAGYQADPESARVTSRVYSTTTGDDPMRIQIGTDAGETRFDAVAHPAVGGYDDAPCSGDLLMAAYAACQEITLRLVATAMGIEIQELRLSVTGEWDARGTLGVDRETPVGYSTIHTEISIASSHPEESVKKLLDRYERYCVVGATLRNPPRLSTTYTIESTSEAKD